MRALSCYLGLSLCTLLATGCGTTVTPGSVDQQEDRETTSNSFTLNAFTLNAFTLNSFTLNSFTLNSFTLNTADLNSLQQNGVTLDSASLDKTRLVGKKAAATLVEADLAGVTMSIGLTSGQTSQLRIDSATWNDSAQAYTYTVSLATDQGWVSPCGTQGGVPVPVVFLSGSWDMASGSPTNAQHVMTPACFGSALAKCVLWGYAPWASATECDGSKCRTRSLADWHQACTRMVRADYCGDGQPHTRNGTPIDPWDVLNIQSRSPETWEMEAEWAEDGGHCIRHTRWLAANPSWTESDLAYVQRVCPSRLAASDPNGCNPDTSNFLSSNGFNTPIFKRNLVRNSSPPPM
jgi:hypothetical protein